MPRPSRKPRKNRCRNDGRRKALFAFQNSRWQTAFSLAEEEYLEQVSKPNSAVEKRLFCSLAFAENTVLKLVLAIRLVIRKERRTLLRIMPAAIVEFSRGGIGMTHVALHVFQVGSIVETLCCTK